MSGRSGEMVPNTVLLQESVHLVEVDDIWKSFGEVAALRGASMWANRGELTAIVGDNGAGKSTLIKCISGIYASDRGSIRIAGKAVTYRGPQDARHHGIETVYQDLALVDGLTVYQNVFSGSGADLGIRPGALPGPAGDGGADPSPLWRAECLGAVRLGSRTGALRRPASGGRHRPRCHVGPRARHHG